MQFFCVSGLILRALLGEGLRIGHQVAQKNPDFGVIVKIDLEGLREVFRGVMVLGCKCRALGMLGKPSTTESHL